jgi:hypothetical protein
MKRLPRFLGATAAIALALTACTAEDDAAPSDADAGPGGSTGGPSGSGGVPAIEPADSETPAAFATTLAELVCLNLTTCCASTPHPVDADRCRLQFRTAFTAQSGRWAQAWEPAVGEACLEQAAAAAGGACLFSEGLDGLEAETPACTTAFALGRGDAGAGEACTNDDDCALADGMEVGCDGGLCVHEPASSRVGAGDPCGWTCTEDGASTECGGNDLSPPPGECYTNDGLRCGEGGTCEPLVTAGGGCQTSQECAAGLYCGADATCTAQGSAGAPCASPFGDADSTTCATGRCDAATLTCGAPAGEGEACQRSSECASGLECDAEGRCVPAADATAALCRDLSGG